MEILLEWLLRLRVVGLARYFILQTFGSTTPYYVFFAVMALICMAVPYFLGGINFAIIISKKKYGVDIRSYGSGNAGMTNMRRTFGKKAGALTLLGDFGKTVIACLLGYLLLGRLGAYISGLFCIIGHAFPAKYHFKGGKGVACAAVVILLTDLGSLAYPVPVVFFILLALFIAIVLMSKYVSLGSIMCVLLYPLILNAFEWSYINSLYESSLEDYITKVYRIDYMLYTIIAIMLAVIIAVMHRQNIKRLMNGEESKFELKTKGKKTLYETELEKAAQKEAKKGAVKSAKPDKNTSKKKRK